MLAAATTNNRPKASAGFAAPKALPSDWPAGGPAKTMAPNTAMSMVANKFLLKFIVPTEMPS